jgi:hypothetical protein
MNEAKFSSMIYHRVVAKSLRMKELNSLRLQSRHTWRYPESETSRTKLRENSMSSTKLFQIFLLMLCWTLRTVSGQGTAIPLSDGDIQQIVDVHNLFRGMVEPPASNMQRIVSTTAKLCKLEKLCLKPKYFYNVIANDCGIDSTLLAGCMC